MSPTCSSRFFVGRNARSATARTTGGLSSPIAVCATAHPLGAEEYGIASGGSTGNRPGNWRLTRVTAGNVRQTLGGPAAHRRNAALALSLAGASLLATGCAQKVGEQDKAEPNATFPVQVVRAHFPLDQKLAKDSTMVIWVKNPGTKRVPDVSVTIKCPGRGLGGSFNTAVDDSDVSDPERPQFVVNQIPTRAVRRPPALDPAPLERSSSFVDTYPLGPLQPGATARFRWDVTAVKAGQFRLCWRVNAGLYGKSKAVAASGTRPISGKFAGRVSDKAPKAHIGADDKSVISIP